MVRKHLIILLAVTLPGCGGPFSWMKGAKTGTVEESQKHSLVEKTSAEVLVTREPDADGPELPDLKYDVLGKTVSAPPGSRVMIQVGSKTTERSWSLSEALGNFKATTNVGILIIGGGFAVAVGVVLCFFGGLSLGLAVVAFGIAMIACGVVIEQYPWVFLIVLALGLVAGVLLAYKVYKARQADVESGDKSTALAEIVKAIEALPTIEQMNLKTKLAMTDVSATVRKVVDKVKGRVK